jgi:thiamine pyrophosphate-dependent acetolactate synthase large subunit-like protein
MVEMTHDDIERIWDSVVHFIPEKQKLDAAVDFVKTLESMGVEESEIKAIGEYDPRLEEAVSTVFVEEEEVDEFNDRYEDD